MADGNVMSAASIGHAAADYYTVAPATATVSSTPTPIPTAIATATQATNMAGNAGVGGVMQTSSGVTVSTVGSSINSGSSVAAIGGGNGSGGISGNMVGSNINLNAPSMATGTAVAVTAGTTTSGSIANNQGYHQLSVTSKLKVEPNINTYAVMYVHICTKLFIDYFLLYSCFS